MATQVAERLITAETTIAATHSSGEAHITTTAEEAIITKGPATLGGIKLTEGLHQGIPTRMIRPRIVLPEDLHDLTITKISLHLKVIDKTEGPDSPTNRSRSLSIGMLVVLGPDKVHLTKDVTISSAMEAREATPKLTTLVVHPNPPDR